MPVVRCPIHGIPYNTDNPRGCPACWREAQGESSDAEVMRQLARVSMGLPAIEEPPPATRRTSVATMPVTTPPRVPVPQPTAPQRLWRWARAHRATAVLLLAVAVALPLIWVITRPEFQADPVPPPHTGDALPLPLAPNAPIEAAFAVFGVQPPLAHPASPALARFRFPGGFTVDALNSMMYAVVLEDDRRTWRGVRIGMPEDQAAGALALLGALRREPVPGGGTPVPLRGYQVVPTLAERPQRRLVAEIRPPNGCLDVQVDLAPRAIGRLRQADGDLWALARGRAPFEWVVVGARVVSRALPGPWAGAPACPLSP